MKKAIGLIVLSGLASSAFAQTGSLSITSSVATLDSTTTTSFTLSVWGDADFGTHIAGGGFTLSAAGGAGIVTDMVASVPPWAALGFQDNGHSGDGNHDGVIFGQLIFPPFINPDPASSLAGGPVLLASFAVTIAANSAGTIDWSTAGGLGDFVLEIFTDDGGDGSFTRLTGADISFGTTSVGNTPAPSAIALLGFGGLAAGRRRR